MFIQRDLRKVPEIIADESKEVTELKLGRRYGGSCPGSCAVYMRVLTPAMRATTQGRRVPWLHTASVRRG